MKSNGVYTVGVPEPSPPSRRRGLKFKLANVEEKKIEVASFAEAWIEIIRLTTVLTRLKVASFAEAWIEIAKEISIVDALKKVASFAEAWIEILSKPFKTDIQIVASFAEAWIEIQKMQRQTVNILSPPSRRRGLK